MGELNKENAEKSLAGLSFIFRRYITKLESLNFCEIRIVIMALAQYLYCKYYSFGKPVKEKDGYYDITAGTMFNVYGSKELAIIANRIILTRNRICHNINSRATNDFIKLVRESKSLKKLLLFEGIIDSSNNFIEPNDGEYVLSEIRKELDCSDKSENDEPQEIVNEVTNNIAERLIATASSRMSGEN